MKKYIGCAARCFVCWAAVLAVCFGLLCAAAAVPNGQIADNISASSDKLAARRLYERTAGSLYSSTADNNADSILLGIAANMSSEDILRSVIDTRYYDDGNDPASGIRSSLEGREANVDYTRYWHGSLTAVRPLLLLTDIEGIRIVGSAVIMLLLAGNIILLLRGKHTAAAVILSASCVLVSFWFVFTSLEYMTVFNIMLAVLPLYVKFAEDSRRLAVISAGVGTVTAFADFLTSETLTILVPLTVSFFIAAEKGEKPAEKAAASKTVCCGAAWGAGYFLTFAAKWAAASAMLGAGKAEAAVSAAGVRFFASAEGIDSVPELLFSAIAANLSMLAPTSEKISVIGIIIWLTAFAAVCVVICRFRRGAHSLPKAAMLMIAAVPFVRFSLLMNHSYLHNFFTYRALMPSIMAVLGLMWYRSDDSSTCKSTFAGGE